MEEVRTILAGGAPLLQAGMAAALGQDPRVKLLAQVPDIREAAMRARQLTCDVLVVNAEVPHVDAAMALERLSTPTPTTGAPPGTNGLAAGNNPAGAANAAARARTKVLVLTEDESQEEMLAALRAGAHGYGIRTHLWPEDLCAAVLSVARWGVWSCPVVTRYLVATAALQPAPLPVPAPSAANTTPLSAREIEVLCLVARGAGEQHIATTLCLSRNTVKTYLRRICEKLQVASRAEAVSLAIQRGVVPDRRRMAVSVIQERRAIA